MSSLILFYVQSLRDSILLACETPNWCKHKHNQMLCSCSSTNHTRNGYLAIKEKNGIEDTQPHLLPCILAELKFLSPSLEICHN